MSHLLSKQELADKLKMPVKKIDEFVERGLPYIKGFDLFNWYQVKQWLKKQGIKW